MTRLIYMVAVFALALSVVTFPGGSIADLGDHIAKSTGRNVFISQAYAKPIKAFDYDIQGYEQLAFDVRMKAKLHLVPDKDLILNEEMLPPERMRPTAVGAGARQPTWKPFAADSLADGKVTFHTVGAERLDPAALAQAGFSKPVVIHWTLAHTELAISADKVDEKTFLSDVAKAIGAKFVDGKTEYRLDLDPEAFRTRAVNLLEEKIKLDPPSNDPMVDRKTSMRMMLELLRGADRKTIAEAFQTPNSKSVAPLTSGSSVVSELVARYRVPDPSNTYVNRGRVAMRVPGGGVAYLDTNAGFTVELRSNFTAAVGIKLIDQRGRPGTVSLEITTTG